MFVDASAIVAILLGEPERPDLIKKVEAADRLLTSPISLFETILAVLRVLDCSTPVARGEVEKLVKRSQMHVVKIDSAIGEGAIEAYGRFGKGRHKARLNMGDCFAYACAKHHRVPLLCKGNDFVHTDIELA
jgi:ribonuclease VapC